MIELNSENAAKNTYEIAKDTKNSLTSWNEQKTAPKASSRSFKYDIR